MLRSQGFKKWTSLPTSKHTPTSLFHSPNDAAAPFLPLSGCLRSTDRMDSGSVFIGSVFSTACSRAPLRGWGMGEKHSAEGGEWRGWVPESRSRANERVSDVIRLSLSLSCFVFCIHLWAGNRWTFTHAGGGGFGWGGQNATHEKSTHSAKKEAVRWGSSCRTWVSLHLCGANSISSLNADINQSISEERDSQGGLRAAGAVARNAVRHTGLN